MQLNEVKSLLMQVHYKHGWALRVEQSGDIMWLQWRFVGVDPTTGKAALQHGRKWMLSTHATPSECVQTALAAVLACEEHEAREAFTFKGHAVFGPHFNVEGLAKLCATHGLDARVEAPHVG